jgi:hypothetical protein
VQDGRDSHPCGHFHRRSNTSVYQFGTVCW